MVGPSSEHYMMVMVMIHTTQQDEGFFIANLDLKKLNEAGQHVLEDDGMSTATGGMSYRFKHITFGLSKNHKKALPQYKPLLIVPLTNSLLGIKMNTTGPLLPL